VIGNQSLIGEPVVTTDRRAARHQATKQRILQEAWGLAREQGLAGISLRDLAARVDLRQPSLYSYFASKDALYDAMFAQGYEQLLADIEAREFSADPREQVREIAHAFSETCSEDPVRAQLLFQRTLPSFEPTAESYAIATQFLDEARSRLHAAGFTRPEDLDIYTAVIGGLVSQQLANEPGGTRWLDLTDEIVDMYIEHATKKGQDT
jgi:AcrR family transcriptional regulator